ncbi:MAG: hypothetical protein ACODAU_07455 [Myxococcota bacterium]
MRIGVIGPADGHLDVLREAAEFLLGDAGVDQAIYLGMDDAVDQVVQRWSAEVMGGDGEDAFLDRAAQLALKGTAEDIDALIDADDRRHRLGSLRRLPPPPARAIEMVEDRIVVVVHDKGVLDEEDIANAHVIIYGKSAEPLLKRFGPRCFFTPGPLSDRKVGILEVERDGRTRIGLFEPNGNPVWRETLQGRGAKIMVSK